MKLLLDERESEPLARLFTGFETIVSISIVRVEILRALRRAGYASEAAAEAKRLLGKLQLRAVTDDLLERAQNLEPFSLRTLDALHLAGAIDLGSEIDAFVCYDARLAAAARLHGLRVLAPGADEVHEP